MTDEDAKAIDELMQDAEWNAFLDADLSGLSDDIEDSEGD